MEITSFLEMGLNPKLLQRIIDKGFEEPTPIQMRSIPVALKGLDIMGQAKTGTGKTLAFGLPILNKISANQGLQALILCPTRELTVQVAEEMSFFGKGLNIHTLPVYGGQSIEIQLRALKRHPEIIVGTPGRMLDHLERGTIILSGLKFVVLDEADEMLDMGFFPDIQKILAQCPGDRQTFLFSATLVEDIRALGREFMRDPQLIAIASPELTVSQTEQYYYEVNPRQKVETICRIIDVDQPRVSLIFCRTKKGVDELSRVLDNRGYSADALHGDMSQRERDTVMERFRQGNTRILVATDLAARGLDIDWVTHVFNFDIPEDPDGYVHRIGRTGRAGRGGIAITMVEPRQMRQLRVIEHHIGKRIERRMLPSLQDAIKRRQDMLVQQLEQTIADIPGIYTDMAAALLEKHDARQLLAAALKIVLSEAPELETADFDETNADTAHVEIPLGRLQGINPRRLVEFLAANTNIKAREVGDIDIHSNSTYVEVPIVLIDEVYDAFRKYESHHKRDKGPRIANRNRFKSKKA